jgi:Raf kinase inhibitor-like YbhB/YbcL family protein
MRARAQELVLGLVLVGIGLAACQADMNDVRMTLTSEAFADGEAIPSKHTCDGEDVSPPLAWSGAPDGTGAFAVIVRDPDSAGFVHWVLADIPRDTTSLDEGSGDSAGIPGQTDFGRVGWNGPCPPSGEHRYVFTLYALPAPLSVSPGAAADEVERAMQNILAEGSLTGVYSRAE